MKCKSCNKKLKANEELICDSCLAFLSYKYTLEELKEIYESY